MARFKPPKVGWRFWRRASQAAFLLGFLWLFRQTELRADDVPPYVNLAFRLDPLAAAAAMVTARVFIPAMLLSLATVALTVLVGRAFCGWVCPMGTLLDWLGKPMRLRSRRRNDRFRALRPMRYWILTGVLTAAALGFPLVGLFDPFSILHQGLTVFIDPLLSRSSYAAFDWLYQNAPEAVTSVSEPSYAFLLEHSLARQPAVFVGAWVSAVLLVTILLLERVQRRFWCRYVCPLGAMLGLVAMLSPFRRRPAKACRGCRECERTCRMDAFDAERRLQPQACTACMDCITDCPQGIAQFLWFPVPRSRSQSRPTAPAALEISRRGFIGACVTGAAIPATAAVARWTGAASDRPNVLRPPGAWPDDRFLDLCIRCGECLKVCLTNALQPVLLEDGARAFLSPQLVPRIGYCEYSCTLCLDVCPTGAIRPLDLESKQHHIIGEAEFNEDRCLPYAENESCIVCEEHCPLPEKAIRVELVDIEDEDGGMRTIKRPFVERDLCIGCGICENKCPLEDEPGIRVRPRAPDADQSGHADGIIHGACGATAPEARERTRTGAMTHA